MNNNRYLEVTARVSREHLLLMGATEVTRAAIVADEQGIQKSNDGVEAVVSVLAQLIKII